MNVIFWWYAYTRETCAVSSSFRPMIAQSTWNVYRSSMTSHLKKESVASVFLTK